MAAKTPRRPRQPRRKAGKKNPGLPDPARVVETLTLASPKGRRYTILRTDEQDAYDPKPRGRKRR